MVAQIDSGIQMGNYLSRRCKWMIISEILSEVSKMPSFYIDRDATVIDISSLANLYQDLFI